MPKNVRVTRTRNRAFPFAWRCTVPDASKYTGECGASSFAATEALVAADHAAHMRNDHDKEK